MSFLTFMKSQIGIVDVVQQGNTVIVSGINGYQLSNTIAKYWNTSRISNNIFSTVSSNKFTVQLFFLPDIYYILDKLYNQTEIYTLPKSKIKKVMEILLEKTWLKDTLLDHSERLDLSRLKDLTYTPLEHQMNFINYYSTTLNKYHLNGCLLNGGVGVGKTLIGIFIAHTAKAERTIIVCPKNAVYTVWGKTVKEAFKIPTTYWIADEKQPYNDEQYLIFHYETLNRALDLIPKLRKYKTCVILDESHNLNDINSLRTQSFLQLCKELGSQDIIFASGTPIKALGKEIIPLFRAIDPFFNSFVEARFKAIYGSEGKAALDILSYRLGLVSFKIVKEVLNLDPIIKYSIGIKIPNGNDYTMTTIKALMQAFVKERTKYYQERKSKDEAFYKDCLNYYEQTIRSKEEKEELAQYKNNIQAIIRAYHNMELDVVKEEMKFCNRVELKIIAPVLPKSMSDEFKSVRSVIKYVALKIQGECLGRIVGKKRAQCVTDMVPYINYDDILNSTEKKTIIFTSYVEALEKCMTFLKEKKLNPIAVYGATNTNLRSIVETFEKDPSINPLIATYPSLSTAVPMIMSDTAILLNQPFRDYILQQATGRIWRLGQTNQVRVFDVVLDTLNEPNISSRTLDILRWSIMMVEAITGVKAPEAVVGDINELSVSNEMLSVDTDIKIFSSINKEPLYYSW